MVKLKVTMKNPDLALAILRAAIRAQALEDAAKHFEQSGGFMWAHSVCRTLRAMKDEQK